MLVRNVKYALKKDHNIYIGHGNEFRKTSPLANPYRVKNWKDDAERWQCILDYKKWLWKKMLAGDPVIWAELRKMRYNTVLLCHCYPKRCHGEVIRNAWTWAYKQGLIPHPEHNHDGTTLERVISVNRKELEPVAQSKIALDKTELSKRPDVGIDGRLDANILHQMPEPDTRTLQKTQPTKQRGRGAPRKPRGIVYIQPDTQYNDLDDLQADIAELPQAYRWTETVWTTPTVGQSYLTA